MAKNIGEKSRNGETNGGGGREEGGGISMRNFKWREKGIKMLEEQSHQQLIQDGSQLKCKIRKVFILQSTKCSNKTIGYNEIYKISTNNECRDAYINKVEREEEKEIKLRIKLI